MLETIRPEERNLLLKLTGPTFPELDVLEKQLDASLVERDSSGTIWNFHQVFCRPFTGRYGVLGEGSLRDADDVSIVLVLLERSGFLWKLDISRVDGRSFEMPLHFSKVRSLGYGSGLTLERPSQ